MKRLVTYLKYTLFATLLQACINEKDHSAECAEVLLLQFKYEVNNEYINQFDAHVDKVMVYIFDDTGRYVTTVVEEGESLSNDYVMRIPLPAGYYDLVAYGGDDDMGSYSVGELDQDTNVLNTSLESGVTSIEDFHIELNAILSEDEQLYSSDTSPDHLFVGYSEDAISVRNNQVVTKMDLIKNTNDITVKIVGDNTSTDQYSTTISAINGRYDYKNSVEPNHGTVNYQSSSTQINSDGAHQSQIRTMRLMLDSPSSTRSVDSSGTITVTSSDSDEVIYQESIVDQLLGTQQYSSQDDLDREDEYEFEITVESDVVVAVTINGWQIINITPDI